MLGATGWPVQGLGVACSPAGTQGYHGTPRSRAIIGIRPACCSSMVLLKPSLARASAWVPGRAACVRAPAGHGHAQKHPTKCAAAAQLPVERPPNLETTSLGAAFAAGIGAGFWTREWVLGADQGQLDAATVFRPQVQDTLLAPVPPEKDWTCSECPELPDMQTCCLYRPFAHHLDPQKTLIALICVPPELCAGSET